MELYPHNKEAVDAIKEHYAKGNRKAAVVHATGTGKSYIIASIVEDYKHALIIAPNNFVLDETRKVCHSGCDFRTYASIMRNEGECNAYDIIVLDEFHRGGADKWGEGVRRIIETNPKALLLGTSATHIRYLDNQRNMADELFDGQVVSYLTLRDAIAKGILPNPTYVSSIYSMDDTVRSRKQKIKQCRKKNVDKEELCRRLEGIAHNWDNAGGVSHIIHKYITEDMQRIIVFCSKVKRAAEARQLLSRWFGLAGFNRVRYYNIDYKEKRLEKEMKDFQEPLGVYDLKVAISVNMLNEGVHIPHVDGVIMLRSTISRIIIEQQVGRCLTSNNSNINPVVLDMVNNMDLIRYDEPVFTGEFVKGENTKRKEYNYKGFPFTVIDECRDLRILLEQLDSEIDRKPIGYWTFERCKEEALKYKRRIDFYNAHPAIYSFVTKKGWADEILSHMPKPFKYSKEDCIQSALKYGSRKEWEKAEPGKVARARKSGWYDECVRHMAYQHCSYTKEECIENAKKYPYKSMWAKSEPKYYDAAKRNGWLDECRKHMVPLCENHTKESCMKSAEKFSLRYHWYKADRKRYNAALRNGWLDECCAHMEKKNTPHSKEDCIESAKQYKTKSEWLKNCRILYDYAHKKGWFSECISHMKTNINNI